MGSEAARAAAKRLYDRRRAAGQCVRCGEPSPDRIQCDDCRPARNKYQQSRYREMMTALGKLKASKKKIPRAKKRKGGGKK